MKLEINKIVTLGNNEEYLIVDMIEYEGKEYYYVAEVNEDGSDIKDNYKIVYATYNGEQVFLDEVLGEEKLKVILPLFIKE